MTTWAQPIRHPWFDPPSLKRKHFSSDDDDHGGLSDVSPAPPTGRKRVRYNSLERTLAHMTLGNAPEDVDMWPKISLPRPSERETLGVVLPTAVEEPGPLVSEPVDSAMEVEPAVAYTSAPLSHPGHDWASRELEIKEVEISPAVLDCLRRQVNCPSAPIPLLPQTSQALVLYQALRLPPPEAQVENPGCIVVAREDDVMEVE